MKRLLLLITVCFFLSSCLPSSQGPSPTITPVAYTLNDAEQIKQYLTQWAPTAKSMGYDYEIMDVTPETDANGNITGWVIFARDPGETYDGGMCVVPIIGLSLIIKNYLDTGRKDDIPNVAPWTLATIKVNCFDSEGVDQQLISTKWSDVVALGKGALTTSKMFPKITVEP
jgi:hypothetical protein